MSSLKKGFTLIELLIVISIIGILSVLVVLGIGAMRVKARNANAQSDASEMSTAIEQYRDSNADAIIQSTENILTDLSTNTYGGEGLNGANEVGNPGFKTALFLKGTGYPLDIVTTPSTQYTYIYKSNPNDVSGTHPMSTAIASYELCVTQEPVIGGDSATWRIIQNGTLLNDAQADCPAAP